MKTYSKFKKEQLKDELIRRKYEELHTEFMIAEAIIGERLKKGLTQSELAKKVGTKQSAISRLESGQSKPSIAFLEKVAQALDLKLRVSFY
jgi:ribosome-binding protein aMBF1 (putative translation factor)